MNTDPYNWPFPQKQQTMYLSTVNSNDAPYQNKTFLRQSSFQKNDIDGTIPRLLVAQKPNDTNFSLSTYIQPKPQRNKTINKLSDPLKIDDIQGARPRATDFRTRRIVDPLCPKYQLSSCSEFSVDPGRKFIRDTLQIDDINPKKRVFKGALETRDPIHGSRPMPLTKTLNAISRLQVKDINKDLQFESTRSCNPLVPNYLWRDNDNKNLNMTYGNIVGTQVRKLHPVQVNKQNNLSLNTKDIDGAWSGSCFSRAHFIDKRRQFKNYMDIKDIQKSNSSSLKKGIDTKRQINPLMPAYQYLGHSQQNK